MNYGKRGVKAQQRRLDAVGGKMGRKFGFLLVKLILAGIIGIGICGCAAGIGVFKGILADTPTIHISDIVANGQATMVYDNQGNKIDEYVGSDSNRIEVTWDKVPKMLGYAFVAIEDERFYQHNGIDYKSIVRAGYNFAKTRGKEAQGASTITQQLLKNTIFTSWTDEGTNKIKKIKRKIQEQYLALEVTKATEKDDILIRYMNAINMGQNTLGVESASQRYFGKSAIDLTISECAVLASITQNPSWYNPLRWPEHNQTRRETCLNKMLELGFISQEQWQEAMDDTEAVYERISYHDTVLAEGNTTAASYFTDAVYEQVLDDLIQEAGYDSSQAEHMLNSGGLRIYTTMDPDIQSILDEEFENPDNYNAKTNWYLNYALTIYDEKQEAHNFSKEKMTAWFKEQGQSKFNLIFESQEAAEEAIDQYRNAMFEDLGLEESGENYKEKISLVPQPQVAMVVEDQSTGYIVAMEGGRGVKEGRRTLNRATDALRSPGSTFKVLASFAPALDSGEATLATTYNDAPFNYSTGTPVSNWYHGYYKGICSIRYAVEQSLNIIAVKNQTVITPELGYEYLLDFGFSTLTNGTTIKGKVYSDVRQTIALGGLTLGVSPFELNAGYATIANGGVYEKPTLYTTVTDSDGNIILDHTVTKSHRVLKETTAWLLTDAMKGVLTSGTGGKAKFSGQAIAGKTGTSSDYKDVWFAGYTPYYTASVWTGYDNAIGMSTASGNDESAISKRLWKAVMSRIHENLEYVDFEQPEGIIQMTVCSQSGKLPSEGGGCAGTLKTEYFAEDNVPEEECNVHFYGIVCAYDGKIACENCPFKMVANVTLPLEEPDCLLSGSSMITTDEEGNEVLITPQGQGYCQHNAAFFMQENFQDIINWQSYEMQMNGNGYDPYWAQQGINEYNARIARKLRLKEIVKEMAFQIALDNNMTLEEAEEAGLIDYDKLSQAAELQLQEEEAAAAAAAAAEAAAASGQPEGGYSE